MLHHPAVEGFVFIQDRTVGVAYFQKLFMSYKDGKPKTEIGCINGTIDDHCVCTIESGALVGSTYFFCKTGTQDGNVHVTPDITEHLADYIKTGTLP